MDEKASKHGNYFGLHANGTDPGKYFPGQIGTVPTAGDGPLAVFDPGTGFYHSGLRLAARMRAGAGTADLSNPSTFFSVAHSLGWGTTNPDYLRTIETVYDVIRRSAEEIDRRR